MHETLGQMLTSSAGAYGRKPAVVCADRTLTFAELDRLSLQFANHLSSLSIGRGDRVTLWMENGWRWMVAYYAVLRAGAVVVPCNIVLTSEEVSFIIEDSGSRVVIGAREKVAGLRIPAGVVLIVDRPGDGASGDLESLLGEAASGASAKVDEADLGSKAPATVGYTSGTTGRPKGAVLRHEAILVNAAMTALMHGRTSSDIAVSALPCTHVYGNIVMNSAVMCGMTLVLLARFDEEAVLEAIVRHRATIFEGVPTMYYRLLDFGKFGHYDLSSLRVCTVGGQTMPKTSMEEAERRFGCRLLELWGMTEVAGLGTTHAYNGPSKLGSIGVPLPSIEARVMSTAEEGHEVRRGEIGELVVRGAIVMEGYLNNAEATQAAIDEDGWLHTGDLVRQDSDGYFYVIDRAKEVILSGGYNVYPAEVERVIAAHPAVSMVAVAAKGDRTLGHVPKAFVVLRDGMQCTADEIIVHCRAQLAAYKTPRSVEFINELPRNSTGKILRRALAGG